MSTKILIADDEEDLNTLLGEIIKTFDYWESEPEIILAASGKEALEKLDADSYDLFITDHNMPGMSGVETILTLRGGSLSNASIPCLLVSGHIGDELNEQLADQPRVHLTEKPTPMAKLHELIKEILEI